MNNLRSRSIAGLLTACVGITAGGCGSSISSDGGTDGSSDTATSTDVGSGDASSDASTSSDSDGTDASSDVATGDAGRPGATVSITGTVSGASSAAVDVAFEPTTSGCGGTTGVVIATSGASIACGAPLTSAVSRPYVILRLSRRDVGTYNLVPDGSCTASTTDRVFTATFDAMGISTIDGTSGTVEITASTGSEIAGQINVSFGSAPADTITGTFTATSCL